MTDEERAAIAAVEGIPLDAVQPADTQAPDEAPDQTPAADAPGRARALLAAGFRAEVVAARTGLALDACREIEAEVAAATPRRRSAVDEAIDGNEMLKVIFRKRSGRPVW